MYVDAIYDKSKEEILVVERINKERVFTSYPACHRAYYESPTGTYKSIFGDKLQKYETNDSMTFRKVLNSKLANKKVFESDINVVFRCLEEKYQHVDTPELNICFFDIETDFNPELGFANPWKPFAAITAITLYPTQIGKLITLVLRPKKKRADGSEYVTKEEAEEIVSNFDDTFLFEKEEDLLKAFIDLIQDSDCLSGWNCMSENSSVWLKDRIIKLKDIQKNQHLVNSTVVNKSDLLKKKKVLIKLSNGSIMETSIDHRFPVFVKEKEKCTSFSKEKTIDLTVKDIINKKENNECFVEVMKHTNTNSCLTYRNYILNNLDYILEKHDICLDNLKIKIDRTKSRKRQKCYSKLKDSITKNDVIDYIQSNNKLKLYLNNRTTSIIINLDDIISKDLFYVLGMIYTDGSFYNETICIYNNDINVMKKISNTLDVYKRRCTSKMNNFKKSNRERDKTYRYRISSNNEIGFLSSFIFNNNKSLNEELLSLLSSEQFFSFFSGCIDGDGWVDDYVKFANCNNNDIYIMQNLLYWNSIYSSISGNSLHVSSISHKYIQENVSLIIEYKKEKINSLNNDFCDRKSSNKANLSKFRYFDDKYIVKIDSIEVTDDYINMYDIETNTSYFHTSIGVKTHNSKTYDIPYIVNRVKDVLGKMYTRKFCLWNKEPIVRTITKFEKETKIYDLVGITHLDYLDLYMKHTPQQRHSYRLDFIGEIEVGENKEPYEGTFDSLYNEEFEKFIRYSRQDVNILVKLDQKKKYIDLANQIAHANCVLLKTTMGSVALIDQAITLEAHSKNLMVPISKREMKTYEKDDLDISYSDIFDDDDDEESNDKSAAGAYVAKPKIGIHDFIGCIDLNSLYPSTIRSLNISTETLFGQLRMNLTNKMLSDRIKYEKYKKSDLWEGIFSTVEYDHVINQSDEELILDFETGESIKITGKELYDFIYNNDDLILSANGTLFTKKQTGIIPSLLARWYAERKDMQKKAKYYSGMAHGVEIKDHSLLKQLSSVKLGQNDVIEYDVKQLHSLIDSNDIDGIIKYMNDNCLELDGEIIVPNKKAKDAFKKQYDFWNMRQLARKILLNSLYGALLNETCKFYDARMGQSVTLTGRSIARFMNSRVNFHFTGEEDYKGDAIIYSDTDSCTGDTIIDTDLLGKISINDLFDSCSIVWNNNDKLYSVDDKIKVLSYNPETNKEEYIPMNYVYKHKTSKKKWQIIDENDNIVYLTEDHSVMVERDGALIALKPFEILETDILISV